MITEYTYTIPHGWQPLPPDQRRLPTSPPAPGDTFTPDSPGAALHDLGYRWIAQSAASECGVGQFYIWQRAEPDPAWPRYVADCVQMGDASVVWITDLPTLWEWIRFYGSVSVLLQRHYEEDSDDDDDEEEDPEDGPTCPDCGEPMSYVPLVPLQVVRQAPPDFDA